MFMKGIECPEVKPKAMMNLALTLQKKAEKMAAGGNLESAKEFAMEAGNLLDTAKPLFDDLLQSGSSGDEDKRYASQFGPLRVQCYRVMGSVYVSRKSLATQNEATYNSNPNAFAIFHTPPRLA
jgi:hypothetical protein